jgi:hypothetical protein
MPSVRKKVKVIKAEYVDDVDSILILGEYDEGEMKHQIHSSCFTFGELDVATEMRKTADLMEGKEIFMVFDPDFETK